MADEVHKKFVSSFIKYLKNQLTAHLLTPDAQESVEVAVQCLQAAFDITEEPCSNDSEKSSETADTSMHEIDVFQMYQSLYIERNPESLQLAESIKNEGNRLMKDGKYNEALLQYNRAITFDPKNPIYYCNRAAAFIRLGDNDHAVADCKSALVYNPNYGKAYGRLGIAYSNQGKYSEAVQAYTKAIEMEPDNQDYQSNLEVARNAQAQVPLNTMPQLTEGLNAMLSNPAIRDMFSNVEIDLEQLQNLSQNPVVMNSFGQMFSGVHGGNTAGGTGASMPPDLLQLFQSLASQINNVIPGGGVTRRNPNGPNDQSGTQPPPNT